MTPVVKNHRCTSWAKHARTKNTNDFATLDAELCKNYLLLVGNDEALSLKPSSLPTSFVVAYVAKSLLEP